jgi:prepilin signal peptidase PulO-like enzyme (type II secretory pathway)
LGFLFAFFNLIYVQVLTNFQQLNLSINYILASLISYLLFEILRVSAKNYFKKDALGKGDSKLVSMMALWLGSPGIIISLCITYISSALCLLMAIRFKVIKRNQIVPFAPFLCFGGLVVWFYSHQFIIKSYLSYLRIFS